MLALIALLASILILAVAVAQIRFVGPGIRERRIAQAVALGQPIHTGRHRRVYGYGAHLAR
jgi:HAMP domain-containing protein